MDPGRRLQPGVLSVLSHSRPTLRATLCGAGYVVWSGIFPAATLYVSARRKPAGGGHRLIARTSLEVRRLVEVDQHVDGQPVRRQPRVRRAQQPGLGD